MSSVEASILAAALLMLSLLVQDELEQKQTDLFQSYPFFEQK